MRWLVLAAAATFFLLPPHTAWAQPEPAPPSPPPAGEEEDDERKRAEDAMFGGEEDDAPAAKDDRKAEEDAMFGGAEAEPAAKPGDTGEGGRDEDSLFSGSQDDEGELDDSDFVIPDDPLTIGGQLYLRLGAAIADAGSAGEQRLFMPNLLDLYLDARPDPRVRGFVQGRLRYDPTLGSEGTDQFGQPAEELSIELDQLWLKTDVANRVYLTVGQQPIRWGSNRIWSPTDFVNARKRELLTLFDDRNGVNAIKVHVPIESLAWNVYAIALLDGADALEDVGGGLRLEMVFGTAELALSALAGKDRKTSFGVDISAGVGDLDITAEVGLTDEEGTTHYEGELSFDPLVIPDQKTRGAYYARASLGVLWSFPVFDDDFMTLGLEYFFNPLGTANEDLYPLLLATGDLQAGYLGEHYAALLLLIPGPGELDELTFTFTTVGNLSDKSFISRLDFSAAVHTRLRLEAYVSGHYGTRGGEFRFETSIPDLSQFAPFVPEEQRDLLPTGAIEIPAPIMELGVNLRVSI